MSAEENKALARRWFAAEIPPEVIQMIKEGKDPSAMIAEGLRTVVEEIFAPDCIIHYPEGDTNREGIIEYNMQSLNAFQDVTYTIEHILAEGDMVAVHGKTQGTHSGPYRGIPATGKKIEIKYIGLWRFAEGKVVEGWGYSDESGMMRQLGVSPPGG